MRSRALLVVVLGGALAACASGDAKSVCYPLVGWATPVFRCAAPAPVVAVAPPPPPPEPAKPPPEPEPELPPPPPKPTAEVKAERIELSETVQFETESAVLLE